MRAIFMKHHKMQLQDADQLANQGARTMLE
jgi:hypothetical protein